MNIQFSFCLICLPVSLIASLSLFLSLSSSLHFSATSSQSVWLAISQSLIAYHIYIKEPRDTDALMSERKRFREEIS